MEAMKKQTEQESFKQQKLRFWEEAKKKEFINKFYKKSSSSSVQDNVMENVIV